MRQSVQAHAIESGQAGATPNGRAAAAARWTVNAPSFTLGKQVKQALEKYIEDNDLQPGDRLPPEAELCELFGVSRTALREGMKVLEVLGVVSIEPGRGSFIRSFDVGHMLANFPARLAFRAEDIRQVADVRLYLERLSIEKAVSVASTQSQHPLLMELSACLLRMQMRAQAGIEFWEDDIAFHRTLALLAENRVLLMVLEIFWNLRGRFPMLNTPEALKERYDRHEQLTKAVLRGDAQAAIKLNEALYHTSLREVE